MHTHIVVLSSFLIRWADYNVDHIESAHIRESYSRRDCELWWIYQFRDFVDNRKILLEAVRKWSLITHTHTHSPIFTRATQMGASMKARKLNAQCLLASLCMCIHLKSMRILLVVVVGASANLRLYGFSFRTLKCETALFPFLYIQMCFVKWDQNKRSKMKQSKHQQQHRTALLDYCFTAFPFIIRCSIKLIKTYLWKTETQQKYVTVRSWARCAHDVWLWTYKKEEACLNEGKKHAQKNEDRTAIAHWGGN